jgi:signal transduction histidine kinase
MRQAEKNNIMEYLFNNMPFIFWKDINGHYLGANDNQAFNMGFASPNEFIGKTIYEILPDKNSAKFIDEFDNQIMKEGITSIREETIATPLGEKTYLSQKSPIYNDTNEIIGMLGFSMDITNLKIERDKLQNEKEQLIKIAVQKAHEKQLVKLATEVAHDIKSPIASLLMLIKSCENLPEQERIMLREIANSIHEIADNLLNQFQVKDTEVSSSDLLENDIILTSSIIQQVIAEKKLQYQKSHIQFDYDFSSAGNFAFIKMQPITLKRMLSNIINNAVEACDKALREVHIMLDTDQQIVRIVIRDNGKGMPAELVSEIMNDISITSNKINGHGIGLAQVREAIKNNQGKMKINSEIDKGTAITIELPQHPAPNWFANEIHMFNDDIIIVLDDDPSIHNAWDIKFKNILKINSKICLIHFNNGHNAIKYLKSLSTAERERILLLTDYELIHQSVNGLDVISETQIKRSILVTNHQYINDISSKALELGVPILPKILSADVPVIIKPRNNKDSMINKCVFIDDNKILMQAMKFMLKDVDFDYFDNPFIFLNKHEKYPKDTKIFFDHDFKLSNINGFSLAEKLYSLGFSKLYLISGTTFKPNELPKYIKAINKIDFQKIKEIINNS